MREIFSFIFSCITDPLGLPIDTTKEWVILSVIGLVAYAIAYQFVGELYSSGDISGSIIGSLIHWTIRAVFFVVMWAVTYGIILIIKFIIANWLWICIAIGLILIFSIIICFYKSNYRTN